MQTASTDRQDGETRAALAACRPGLVGIAVLTAVLALLPVAAALYVLMLFDVVLTGRSGATLAALFGLIAIVCAAQAWLGLIRDRLFVQTGAALHRRLFARLDDAVARSVHTGAAPADGAQAVMLVLHSMYLTYPSLMLQI